MNNTQRAYLEEIIASLKIIISVLALNGGHKFLCITFMIWGILDMLCGMKYVIRSVKDERNGK